MSKVWPDHFSDIIGSRHVLTGLDERKHFSRDIFFWNDGCTADAVLQPGSVEELQQVVAAVNSYGLNAYTRGGGLSYSQGYVPVRNNSVIVDLGRLSAVREVNLVEGYLIADAGCSWSNVVDALEGTGFEIEFTAPFSGIHSTVGGALSQNVPQGMKGILGLEVLCMDGRLVRTGSWGSHAQSPFFPDFGPNLTGVFLGDCGAFGIKTGAALKLRPRAGAVGYCSFAFETYEAMASAMIPLATLPFIRRPIGLDPFKSQNSIKVGFKEALATVRAVAGQDSGLKGLASGARFAAEGSRNFMAGVKWSLHLTVTSDAEAGVAANMEQIRSHCLAEGREIPNLLPQAMAARGFSVRGFLGANGERWVPSNALFPVNRGPEVATAVQAFFRRRRESMEAVGMWESYMTNFGDGYFLCEPSVYWRDEVSSLHLGYLEEAERERFRKLPANPEARRLAQVIRGELRDFFDEIGALHVQLGKFYSLRKAVAKSNWDVMSALKATFDPSGRLNPGNLGFHPRSENE